MRDTIDVLRGGIRAFVLEDWEMPLFRLRQRREPVAALDWPQTWFRTSHVSGLLNGRPRAARAGTPS